MSQAKVDKYKQQKKDRKNPKKVSKIKKLIPYVVTALVVIAIVGFFGISIAQEAGWWTPPTDPVTKSDEEIQSIREALIQATDPNVQYTTAKPEKQKKTPAVSQRVPTTKKSAKK